jgi:acetyltransferase-like isoleucine patch superfamily enzyme
MRKMVALLAFALLPSPLKVRLLRRRGQHVGRNVYIGPVVFDVQSVRLEDSVSIRGFNLFRNVERLVMEEGARIGGWGSWITAADRYKDMSSGWGCLTIGAGSNVTSRHYFDLQDTISIGSQSEIAGFGSVFYTHGRVPAEGEVVHPIAIGSHCYVGSHAMMVPGAKIGDATYVAARAVICRDLSKDTHVLIAGNPATVKKTYDEDSSFFVEDHASFLPFRNRRDVRHLR